MGGVARNGVLCRPIGLAAFGTSRDLLAARVTSHFSQFSVVSRSLSRSRTALYRAEISFSMINQLFFEKFRRGILLWWRLRFDRLKWFLRLEDNRMVLLFGIIELRNTICMVIWYFSILYSIIIVEFDVVGELLFVRMGLKRRISFVGVAGIIRLVSFLFEQFVRNWRKLESDWIIWEF